MRDIVHFRAAALYSRALLLPTAGGFCSFRIERVGAEAGILERIGDGGDWIRFPGARFMGGGLELGTGVLRKGVGAADLVLFARNKPETEIFARPMGRCGPDAQWRARPVVLRVGIRQSIAPEHSCNDFAVSFRLVPMQKEYGFRVQDRQWTPS